MTLKEKFRQELTGHLSDEKTEVDVNIAVRIAEEFAIGFVEFIEGTYSYSNIFDHWYLHADTSKTYTKKRLLEIYKKEKGL
jgi:hypothetical protein